VIATCDRHGAPAPASDCDSDGAGRDALPCAQVPVVVQRWPARGAAEAPALDWAAEECAVSLEYNGVSHAVMMATPQALDDLGVGFSLSEGIVAQADEILDLELLPHALGWRIAMRLTARRFMALKQRRRTLAGRTGCGLCGVDSLEQALRPLPPLPAADAAAAWSAPHLCEAMAALDQAQPLRTCTGATHAAAWLGPDGGLHAVREDVGRHNALDKTLGALLRAGTDARGGALLLTSRASVEMVHKAVAAGVPLLAARSAPTALAVRQARALGLTLVGFARERGCAVYSHAGRLRAGFDQGVAE
jgi:FdhD protein